MTAELVPMTDHVDPPAPESGYGSQYWRMAQRVANTEMVPAGLRGRPDAVLAVMAYGAAVGVDPMVALQQISFIQGRPVPSAELQRSLILAAGHRFDIVEMTNARAVVHGTRTNGSELTVTFTLEDAKRAGLLDKKGDTWRQYPAAMLLARATSQLARALFPDAISGLSYLAEELEHGQPVPIAVHDHHAAPDDVADRIAADIAHDDPTPLELEDPDADDALNPDPDDPGRPF